MKKRMFVSKLLVLLILVVAFFSHHIYEEGSFLDIALEISGYLFLIIAMMGRVWASAYISGKKNQVIVMDGPYSVVRNPLYFFSFLGFLGAGMAFESIIIALALVLVFFLTHWNTILNEEKELHRVFGSQFDEYVKTTPRFIPKLRKLKNPLEVSFNPVVFSRAVLDNSLIAVVFCLAHIIEWAQLNSIIPILFNLP